MATRSHDNQPQPSFFADYRRAVGRRARMITLVTAAATLLAVAGTLSLPDVYSAKAMIVPVQEDKGLMNAMFSQLGGLASLAGAAAGSNNTADLYVTMLKSETVRDPIIAKFDLMRALGHRYRAQVYADLDKSVSVAAGRRDGVVSITVQDSDPTRAAAMANAYVEELQRLTVKLNTGGAGKNRDFLEERLSLARANLAAAEESLRKFMKKYKAVNITEQTKASIEVVAKLKAQLALQEVQLAHLTGELTGDHPQVRNAEASLANLRSQIAGLEGEGGTSAIPSVGAVPALGQEYARLMRQVKIQESLVELLTKQAEMAGLAQAKDVAPLQVLQSASVPDRKSGPHRVFLVLMTGCAALLVSLVGAIVAERFAARPGATGEREPRLRAVAGGK